MSLLSIKEAERVKDRTFNRGNPSNNDSREITQVSRKVEKKNIPSNRQTAKWYQCNRIGHMWSGCRIREENETNQPMANTNLTYWVERGRDSERRFFFVGMRYSDVQDKDYGSSWRGRNEIVVHSGASELVECDIMLLTVIRQVSSVQVERPNVFSIDSNQKGKLPLQIESEKHMLSSVYCIPD